MPPILQHVEVQINAEGARVHRRHILCDAMAIVLRSHHGSFRQDFDCLLMRSINTPVSAR